MHAFGVLDQPEREVPFTEFEGAYLPAMIASQLLLVERCSGQGQLLRLFEEVDVVSAGFFSLLLNVPDYPWRVEFDVDGQHSFCPVNQEERREADIAIWGCVQALEY
jgi:hypothetical protein